MISALGEVGVSSSQYDLADIKDDVELAQMTQGESCAAGDRESLKSVQRVAAPVLASDLALNGILYCITTAIAPNLLELLPPGEVGLAQAEVDGVDKAVVEVVPDACREEWRLPHSRLEELVHLD